jgi:hypothetical protein
VTTTGWPDTTHTDPPTDHRYASATWLLGRHPQLAALTQRVDGVVSPGEDEPDGEPYIDLDQLAQALNDLDATNDAWDAYRRRHHEPQDDAAWDRWHKAGPTTPPAARDIAVMSRTEQSRLRLLAALSYERIRFNVADLRGFDAHGQALITDWCRALQAY